MKNKQNKMQYLINIESRKIKKKKTLKNWLKCNKIYWIKWMKMIIEELALSIKSRKKDFQKKREDLRKN